MPLSLRSLFSDGTVAHVFWHQLSHTQRYLQTMRLCLGRSPITGAVRDWFNVLVYDRQRLTCDLFLKV